MNPSELEQLSTDVASAKELEKRFNALKERRESLDEETFAQMSADLKRQYSALVTRIKPLRTSANEELRTITEEEAELNGWHAQAGDRMTETEALKEAGAIDASEAAQEIERLADKRKQYQQKLDSLRRQRNSIEDAVCGRFTENPVQQPEALKTPQEKKPKKKKIPVGLFIAAGIMVMLIGGGLIALNIINRVAEEEIENTLQTIIRKNDLNDVVRYNDLSVHAALGRVTVSDVLLGPEGDDVSIRADEISISMSPFEAAALARDPRSATLSGVDVRVTGLRITDSYSGSYVSFSDLKIDVKGNLDTAKPESGTLTRLKAEVKNLIFNEVESGIRGSMDDYSYAVEGNVTMMTFLSGPQQMLDDLDSIRLRVAGASLRLGDELEEMVAMMLGGDSWVSNPDNWAIMLLDVDGSLDRSKVSVNSLAFDSAITKLKGSGSMTFAENFDPQGLEVRLQVDELKQEIRDFYIEIARYLDLDMPASGPFTVNMVVGREGEPRFTIE